MRAIGNTSHWQGDSVDQAEDIRLDNWTTQTRMATKVCTCKFHTLHSLTLTIAQDAYSAGRRHRVIKNGGTRVFVILPLTNCYSRFNVKLRCSAWRPLQRSYQTSLHPTWLVRDEENLLLMLLLIYPKFWKRFTSTLKNFIQVIARRGPKKTFVLYSHFVFF